jgi:hypothetical protein
MKRVFADLSDFEAKEFYKNKMSDETIREYLLRLAGIDAEPRKIGRPSSLDMLGKPGFIPTTDGSESKKANDEIYGTWKEK